MPSLLSYLFIPCFYSFPKGLCYLLDDGFALSSRAQIHFRIGRLCLSHHPLIQWFWWSELQAPCLSLSMLPFNELPSVVALHSHSYCALWTPTSVEARSSTPVRRLWSMVNITTGSVFAVPTSLETLAGGTFCPAFPSCFITFGLKVFIVKQI